MEDRTEETVKSYKQFHLRLSQELFDRLERVAKMDDRSVSATMREALRQFIAKRVLE
jgi:predicted transcriptional regulator